MHEFASFVLRYHKAKKIRRGSEIDIEIQNQKVATYHIKDNNKIQVKEEEQDKSGISRKFREIIRFHLAMKNDKAIVMNGNQCTQYTCFDKLINDFQEEWNIFKGNKEKGIVEETVTKSNVPIEFQQILPTEQVEKILSDKVREILPTEEKVKKILSDKVDEILPIPNKRVIQPKKIEKEVLINEDDVSNALKKFNENLEQVLTT